MCREVCSPVFWEERGIKSFFKNKPETKTEIKNTEFNVKDDYVNISVGKLYGEGEFGASKADLRHSGPLYDDRYFRE